MEDFDYTTVWYLYLIKPWIGAFVGFLFALLLEYGLIPFLVGTAGRLAYGIVLVAGFAGIFAEDAIRFFWGLFGRGNDTSASLTNAA